MLTNYQKQKIANKLWVEYLQVCLRDGAAQCDISDVREVLDQVYALADTQRREQFMEIQNDIEALEKELRNGRTGGVRSCRG